MSDPKAFARAEARANATLCLVMLVLGSFFAWLGYRVNLLPDAPPALAVGLPALTFVCVVVGGMAAHFAHEAWQCAQQLDT